MRPTGVLASPPRKETQVQGGHLFLEETQAKRGQGAEEPAPSGEPPAPRGQSCSLPGSFHSVSSCCGGPTLQRQGSRCWRANTETRMELEWGGGKLQRPKSMSYLHATKKNKVGWGVRNDRTLLERVVRTGFSQEGTSEQRHKERDRASRVVSWGEWVLGTGSCKCKGPKEGTCWVYSWNTEKMSMAGVE